MGDIIGNSFKRELGKNTAKVVSNFVFGDNWSTPYRRVGSGGNRTVRREVDAGTVRLRWNMKSAWSVSMLLAKEAA